MYRKILVPLDGSQLAEAVLPHAQALAKAEDAELVLLGVPATPTAKFLARTPGLTNKINEEAEKGTKRYLQKKVFSLSANGTKVSSILRKGSFSKMILKVSEEVHADMIAMSTRGYTGLKRILAGSVADQVVQRSHIPVMLIRNNS